jgi:hypothetical protein
MSQDRAFFETEGRALLEIERADLRAMVDRCGESKAAALLCLNRHTVARALAGLPLTRGTVALLRLKLKEGI